MSMEQFTQEARGEFEVAVTGEYHCGPDHTSPKRFEYEVEVGYMHGDVLDERGFLLDNLSFQDFFDSIGKTDLSCERLVQWAAQELGRQAPRAVKIEVALWAIPSKACVRYRKTL